MTEIIKDKFIFTLNTSIILRLVYLLAVILCFLIEEMHNNFQNSNNHITAIAE